MIRVQVPAKNLIARANKYRAYLALMEEVAFEALDQAAARWSGCARRSKGHRGGPRAEALHVILDALRAACEHADDAAIERIRSAAVAQGKPG